jgi:hypothetical protein
MLVYRSICRRRDHAFLRVNSMAEGGRPVARPAAATLPSGGVDAAEHIAPLHWGHDVQTAGPANSATIAVQTESICSPVGSVVLHPITIVPGRLPGSSETSLLGALEGLCPQRARELPIPRFTRIPRQSAGKSPVLPTLGAGARSALLLLIHGR